MGKGVSWFRVNANYHEHPRVKRAGFWGATIHLACIEISKAFNLEGIVSPGYCTTEYLNHRLSMTASGLRNAPELIQRGLKNAIEAGLLRRTQDGGLEIHDWDEHQKNTTSADRMKEYRRRQKESKAKPAKKPRDVTGDVTGDVTKRAVTSLVTPDGTITGHRSITSSDLLPVPEGSKIGDLPSSATPQAGTPAPPTTNYKRVEADPYLKAYSVSVAKVLSVAESRVTLSRSDAHIIAQWVQADPGQHTSDLFGLLAARWAKSASDFHRDRGFKLADFLSVLQSVESQEKSDKRNRGEGRSPDELKYL